MLCVIASSTMPGARSRLLILVLLVAFAAGCREDGDITIKSLNFEGVSQVSKGDLQNALQTKRGSRLPWGRKSRFSRAAFDADLQRIVAFYTDRGFPDARVTSFDVMLNQAQDQVDVTVRINEGQPTVVDRIDLQGFDVLSESEQRSLADSLPLRPEMPLDRPLVLATRERALNVLRDRGYAYAEVVLDESNAAPRRVRLLLSASAGRLAHFGPVEIVGPKTVTEEVVRRQLTYRPGDVYTRRDMRESQRKLYGLDLFEFATVESQENRDTQPPDVATRVTVAEGKHQKVTFGVGYGSEEKARARIRWDHSNILNGAQHLGAEAKWSSLERGVRLEYREPYFLSPRFSLNFEAQAWQNRELVYASDQLGGRIVLRHQTSLESFWSASLINEYQKTQITEEGLNDPSIRDDLIALGLDPRDGFSKGTVSAIALDVGRNTTGNLLDARRGYLLSAHAEQAGKWLWGSFNYYQVTAEARHYFSIGQSFVVANRLRLGALDPVGDIEANIPFYKRYFLGGSSSLRGWGRFEVSPLTDDGLPIGGHTMVEGSSELRMPLAGKLGGVLFFDYGNVWTNPWDFNFNDLRYDVGPGLRYLTPIGPVRVDVGYQLNRIPNLDVNGEPEKRHWRLHFSVGQAF